jgi:hypothetical protein
VTFPSAAASCYLIGCFLFASGAKIRAFGAFAASIREMTPGRGGGAPLAAAVIAGELGVAAIFIASAVEHSTGLRRIAAAAAICLGAILACAIAQVLLSGRKVACNCFGEAGAAIDAGSLAGPLLVIAAGMTALLGASWPSRPATWIASAACATYLLLLHYAWGSRDRLEAALP